jgi:hypothetical protein
MRISSSSSTAISGGLSIPPRDKAYLAEGENLRIDGKLVQRHIRYVGREADGKTVVRIPVRGGARAGQGVRPPARTSSSG